MVKGKKIMVLSMIVMLAVFTGAWAGGAQERVRTPADTLVVAYPDDVAHFDNMATTAPPKEVRHLVFEQLYGLDAAQIAQPLLVKSHEISSDGLTWTMELRDDVVFHDGQPMTSADVVASWNRFVNVGAKAHEFNRVDEVVAAGDHTVEFRLNDVFGVLHESLAGGGGTLSVYPEWVIDEIGNDDLVEMRHIVGTGPYTVEEIVPEERYILSRFDDYAQPVGEPSYQAGKRNAPMERIDVRVIPDNATRLAALEAGDVDLIQAVPLDDAKRLEDNPNTNVEVTSPGYRVYYKFNVSQGPFADPVLREAVRMAIDPEELMLAIGDPDYWRINHAMRYQEEQWMWSDVAFDYYKNDLEAARELVEQSDYDGELIRFLASPGRALEYRTVVPMEQTLRDLGLNVEIQSVDAATFSSVRAQVDQWEIKHAGGGSMSMPVYLNSSASDRTGTFWPGLPEEWHEMIGIVAAESDQELREEAVQRLHELNAEFNNEMWIGDVFELAGSRTNVHNVPPWFKLHLWNVEKR